MKPLFEAHDPRITADDYAWLEGYYKLALTPSVTPEEKREKNLAISHFGKVIAPKYIFLCGEEGKTTDEAKQAAQAFRDSVINKTKGPKYYTADEAFVHINNQIINT